MKLQRPSYAVMVYGGLTILCVILFLLVAYQRFGLSHDSSLILSYVWLAREPWEVIFWIYVTSLGSWESMVGFTVVWSLVLLLSRQGYRAGLLAAGFVISEALTVILKNFFEASRPETQLFPSTGFGFPSGHTMTTLVVFGLATAFLAPSLESASQKRWLYLFNFFTIISVGLSRIALGVHYPTDVIAGWFLGAALLFFLLILFSVRQRVGVVAEGQVSKALIFKGMMVSVLVQFIGFSIYLVLYHNF